jgi:hypothetical protein
MTDDRDRGGAMSDREDVRELADLMAEWRKTCRQMGLRFTDRDAAEFIVSAGFGRAALPSLADQVRALADNETLIERVARTAWAPNGTSAWWTQTVIRALADALTERTDRG